MTSTWSLFLDRTPHHSGASPTTGGWSTTSAYRRALLSRKKNDVMRLVDVSYAADVSADGLHIVAQFLPDLIAEAVDGSEQPWTGPASVRDIEVRFRRQGEFDVGKLRFLRHRGANEAARESTR